MNQRIIDPQETIQQKIDRLERNSLDTPNLTLAPPPWGQVVSDYSLVRVMGLANFWADDQDIQFERYMEDLVTGLYGQKIPFAFLILGKQREIQTYVGARSRGDTEAQLLQTALHGSFPGIELAAVDAETMTGIREELRQATAWIALTGTPTIKTVKKEEEGRVQQIERLLRGLYGHPWGYLVLGQPIPQAAVGAYTNQILAEITANYPEMKKTVQRGPTLSQEEVKREVQYYIELLEAYLERLKVGKAQGLWSVQAHLFSSDQATLNRGQAILRAVFAGKESRPEPVRTLPCVLGGGRQEPVTPLNSRELATLTQLPQEEFPGYAVRDYARFDVALPEETGEIERPINIGKVMDTGRYTGNWYAIERDDFAKHGLVVGVTGSGKTNTIFYLLDKLWDSGRGLPFLVIEPAKTEYRDLRTAQGFEALRVFTLGDERWAPFRLNPFEFEIADEDHRIHVQTHIDFLKSVFNAAFILYAPMPYVLETCLHEIYEDRGWDLTTSQNRRLPPQERGNEARWPVFPTMTDLYHKIDEVVDRLGYEERIQMDVKAGLKARVGSLRLGGKGLMLDTRHSVPMSELLSRPTVLELERVGNDDEKAFLIGLILTRLYEHRRVQAMTSDRLPPLQHVTVFEEAHRLLKNVPTEVETEGANTKGQAVETFANMLSEIRAYGQGVLIAEQIPDKLAPDAIKNTNLKIMHRIVAQDDREVMGGAMNVDEAQGRFVTTLRTGQAVAYAEGADRPYLVEVINFKGRHVKGRVKDSQVQRAMSQFCDQSLYDPLPGYRKYFPSRAGRVESHIRDMALAVVGHSEFPERFSRYFLSLVEEPRQAVFGYNDLLKLQGQVVRPRSDEEKAVALYTVLYAVNDLFEARGRQYGWFYNSVETLRDQLMAALANVVRGFENKQAVLDRLAAQNTAPVEQFAAAYKSLCSKAPAPYTGCAPCKAKCLYRYEVGRLVADKSLERDFVGAIRETSDDEEMWGRLRDVCLEVARSAIVVSDEAVVKQVALCYAAQMGPSLEFSSSSQRKMVRSVQDVLGMQ